MTGLSCSAAFSVRYVCRKTEQRCGRRQVRMAGSECGSWLILMYDCPAGSVDASLCHQQYS
jgi:hypothetical protein